MLHRKENSAGSQDAWTHIPARPVLHRCLCPHPEDGVSTPTLPGRDEETMAGSAQAHPNFQSCHHDHCFNLKAVRGRLLVGLGHGPLCTSFPTPPARRADSGWDARGRAALVTLLMMDVSSPARQEGGLAGHVPGALLRSCYWALPNWAI